MTGRFLRFFKEKAGLSNLCILLNATNFAAISNAEMQKQRRSEGNRSMGQLFYSFKKRRPVSYYFSYLFLLVDQLFQKINTVSSNSYNFFSYYFNVVFHFYILLYFMCI